MSEANTAKDTIYIDTEDEITAIIEKVRESNGKVVALVLPKRSSTMQSVVNLKLLQKTAKDAKKNLVLVTSDPNLLPLAGAVGLHVAKTPQSKPEIPGSPTSEGASEAIETVEAAAIVGTTAVAANKVAKARKASGSDSDTSSAVADPMPTAEDTIDLDNDKAAATTGTAIKKGKKDKKNKIKVPNFDRFRVLLFVGIALFIALIVGGYFAVAVLPKAKIVIKTDTATVNTDLTLTASTKATTVDVEKNIIPATSKEVKKTDSQKAPATGQRDDGTKASGKVTLSLTDCSQATVVVPAGTIVTANSLNFVTQTDISLNSVKFGNQCKNSDFPSVSTGTVSVTAQSAGDKYNLAGRAYVVQGFGNVSAKGTDMTGGTSKITQVVSQGDVDGAKQKAIDTVTATAGDDLKKQFNDAGMVPLTDTLSAGTPTVTSSPNVGDPATEVSVNVSVTFSELGVKTDDLKQVVEADAKKQIDTSKQAIQDNGVSKAVIRTTENKTADGVKIQVQSIVVAGAQLDADGIKKEIAGKKKGETQAIILARPGMKDVTISYSPFWVAKTPKNVKHINIVFEQANGS
jgi:hypothetical protein